MEIIIVGATGTRQLPMIQAICEHLLLNHYKPLISSSLGTPEPILIGPGPGT
ncbi:hypothetical protein SynWH8103_00148 [Synechococcus sp. WH 8103]|nr:hypothetical protein SynWH8103_00148 [Synechococcus sp. WH 8103]